MRKNEIAADEAFGMLETGQRDEGGVSDVFGAFPDGRISRIFLPDEEQARHGHGREDVFQCRPLLRSGRERPQVVGQHKWPQLRRDALFQDGLESGEESSGVRAVDVPEGVPALVGIGMRSDDEQGVDAFGRVFRHAEANPAAHRKAEEVRFRDL